MQILDNSIVELEILGQRIRRAREARGLSQEEFAELIARDQRAVSEYENGKRRISVNELPRMAAALDVPLLYFFEGETALDDLDTLMLQELRQLPTPEAKQSAIDLVRVLRAALERR